MSSSPLEQTRPLARMEALARRRAALPPRNWRPGSYLLAAPHALVLTCFLILPVVLIVVISFWTSHSGILAPTFTLENYRDIFTSKVYRTTYVHTIKLAAVVWALTLAVGFPVAYFLAFSVQSVRWRLALFLLCTVPFLTSNVIRSIAWIPFLGRQGILNDVLLAIGIVRHPVTIFLYSDFSVALTMVQLFSLYMIVPIFNTMLRIDKSLVEAARDGGASSLRVLTEVVIPLSAPGIMIGTIFVVALSLGDFLTVSIMGGGQSSAPAVMLYNNITSLEYPAACANAVVLLVTTLLIVGVLLRFVDIRKEM